MVPPGLKVAGVIVRRVSILPLLMFAARFTMRSETTTRLRLSNGTLDSVQVKIKRTVTTDGRIFARLRVQLSP